jgi:trehalose 6-phosphate phosphatase
VPFDNLSRLPPELWERAARAPHRFLMLDYDGTLAPFRVDRREARPAPGTRERLRRIAAAGGSSVAVISGRSVADLNRLLEDPPFHLVGEQGWEWREPGGATTPHPLPPGVSARLRRAAERAEARGWAAALERKRSSILLHTRGLPRARAWEMEHDCAREWESLLAGGDLRMRHPEGGLEIRAAARNKGDAVRDLLAASPSGTFPIYLGDDDSDEDAFREVAETGFGIRIGNPARSTLASGWLPSEVSVESFLMRWERRFTAAAAPREDSTWLA